MGGVKNYFVEQTWELTEQSVAYLKTFERLGRIGTATLQLIPSTPFARSTRRQSRTT